MVDTINPNTGQPDVPQGGQTPIQTTEPDNRFYGGFDKPDDTKINLADTAAPAPQAAFVPPAAPPVQPQAVQDVNPVQPSEVAHTTYTNMATAINWRGILVIVGIGLLVTALSGVGLYFGLNAMNNSSLEQKQAELDTLNKKLSALSEYPDPLELPVTEVPVEEKTVTTPVVETPVVTPTPIETPATVTPVLQDDGSRTSAG